MKFEGINNQTAVPISIGLLLTFAGFVWWMSALWSKVQTIDQINARVSNLEVSKEETQQALVQLKSDVSYIRVSIDDLKKALADRNLPKG